MGLALYNSLSKTVSSFTPFRPATVAMYVCGITPYDACHLGHARSYVVFDLLRRVLTYGGYHVRHVQNFTDVDDKIIQRARETHQSPKELAQRYIADYFTQFDRLNVLRADAYPLATQHINDPDHRPNILEMIQGLLEKGVAYRVDGDVYFAIGRFAGYGRLSHRCTEELLAGARVEVDPRKRDPLDFALWKASQPGEPAWDSPWGPGRPGWHIECSAMSMAYLGVPIDIHGGGQDLLFPHHENELAQSEAFSGQPFVRWWIHNGFVTINREKMSKSLGNFFTLQEIFTRYWPEVVRLFLVSHHYRAPIDFSPEALDQAKRALLAILNAVIDAQAALPSHETLDVIQTSEPMKIPQELERELEFHEANFKAALEDDLNTPIALAEWHRVVHRLNQLTRTKASPACLVATIRLLYRMADVLGIRLDATRLQPQGQDHLQELLVQREAARQRKDWAAADAIRLKIQALGFVVEDTPAGPRLKQRT
ncbi:MAG: cysteine--tRNA ligase [Elusimicrobia bacterium]|nr:cysteine--tRNA ligase [Elusimicrobiota bacterium]